MHKHTFLPLQVNPLIKGFSLSLLCAAIALASGCGTKTIKPKVYEPTKLVKLASSQTVATPVFGVSVPEKSKLASVNQFKIGIDGNQIIIASSSGQVQSHTLSGSKIWSIDVGDEIVGGVSFDASSQTVIVTTKSAQVMALDSSDGSIKWQTKLNGTVLAPALIHNNRVVLLANDGEVRGLSLQTGSSIWQFVTQTPGISVRGSAAPTLLDDSTILIGSADGRLHGLDLETGIPKWARRVGVPSGASEIQRMTDVDATPVIDNNQLFAVSYSGQLIGVDLTTRQIMFVADAASKNSLAVTDNAVIVTTLDGMVKAYNRNTGEPLWARNELAYRQLSNPVSFGRYIAVGDLDGVVHFLSPVDGRIVSRTQTKGAIHTLQAQSDYLMTQTESGQVSVWKLAN